MNLLTIAGNLGADPEVRFTTNGQKVTSFRVGTRGRKADITIWWRVTVWGDSFDKMISFLKKGSAVIVTGEMDKPEIFTDKEGKQHISLNLTASNIKFSPFGRSDRTESSEKFTQPAAEKPIPKTVEVEGVEVGAKSFEEISEIGDDEVPF